MSLTQLWYTEDHSDNIRFSLKVKECLYRGESLFQAVEVYQTEDFGRLLVLDGLVMTTERDEFVYHEMISHVPLLTHPNPKRVLVIGGGDGGTIREIAKHPGIEEIILCEIDEKVVDVSRQFLPGISCALNGTDPRIKVVYEDGFKFIPQFKNHFDLIVVDSTDPIGPGKVLFSPEFYQLIFDALSPDGIMTNQSENPWYAGEIFQGIVQNMKQIFPLVKFYNGSIPTYPSGLWTFGFASKKYDPEKPCGMNNYSDALNCRYYTPQLHSAAFQLPAFQKKLVDNA